MKIIQTIAIFAAAAVFAGCASEREEMHGGNRVEFNQLPPAAQATVRHEVGNQQIARIDEKNRNGQTAYRVEVAERGFNPVLWVAPDGSIIEESHRLASKKHVYEPAGAPAPEPVPAPAPVYPQY